MESIPVEPMTRSSLPTHIVPPLHDRVSALEQADGILTLLGGMGLAGLAGWLLRRKPSWLMLALASLASLAGVLWIFRNPARKTPGEAGLVVAPCDGEVQAIALLREPRFLRGQAHRVTLRVRPGDVQVTRAPVRGVVRYRNYQPGPRDDALWLGIRRQDGVRVLIRLKASGFWRIVPSFLGRRITALLDLEDPARQGQISGRLPLGGEVEVYIPVAAQMAVRPGDRVRAGETVLARL